MPWDSVAPKPGEQAPDLDLLDEAGRPVTLSLLARPGPLLALIFRDPEDEESVALLCAYRDVTLALRRIGVNVCAIGRGEPGSFSYLREFRGLGFPLLADPDGTALARWGMAGETGLFVLERDLRVKQRALGGRAPADAMVAFLRRGMHAPRWRDRVAHALYSIAHALQPRRLAR